MKFHEVSFFVDDVVRTTDFYERLLNAKPAFRAEGIAIFQTDNLQLVVHRRYEPKPQWPPCENHIGWEVENLDAAIAQLEQQGIRLEVPARDYEWGRSAYVRDPAGQLIELHEEPPQD
jgi:catechol 2,3-dioxygenase-like lactoylglutathione lyase family enzyme